jgi:hypothetical protein
MHSTLFAVPARAGAGSPASVPAAGGLGIAAAGRVKSGRVARIG